VFPQSHVSKSIKYDANNPISPGSPFPYNPSPDIKLDQIPPESLGEPQPGRPVRSSVREGQVLNPQHIERWTVEDVCVWLCSLGASYEVFERAFRDYGIDGPMLLRLDDEELRVDFKMQSRVQRRKILQSVDNLLRGATRERSSTNNSSHSRGSNSTNASRRSLRQRQSSNRSYSVPIVYDTIERFAVPVPERMSRPHSRANSQSRKGSMESLYEKSSCERHLSDKQGSIRRIIFDRSPKHGEKLQSFDPIYENQTITPQIQDPIIRRQGSLRSTSRRRAPPPPEFYNSSNSLSDPLTDYEEEQQSGYAKNRQHDDGPFRQEITRLKKENLKLKEENDELKSDEQFWEEIARLKQENLKLKEENNQLKFRNQRLSSHSHAFPDSVSHGLDNWRDPSREENNEEEGMCLARPEMVASQSVPIASSFDELPGIMQQRGRRASQTVDSEATGVTVTTTTSSNSSRKTSFSRTYYSTSPRVASSSFDYHGHVRSRENINILGGRPGWVRISVEAEGREVKKWISTSEFAKKYNA